MRQAVRKSVIPSHQLFLIRKLEDKHFDPVWHFHTDYQLFFVEEGTGTRFIGDDVRRFGKGELVFTGPNLPHLWRSDEKFFNRNDPSRCSGIVLYLKEEFPGHGLLEKDELKGLKKLMEKSVRGLEIGGETRGLVVQMMQELFHLAGTRSLIRILEVLDMLSSSKDLTYISAAPYENTFRENEADRMSRIYAYVMDHFKQEIRLNKIAAELCMTPTSFSRYFTMKTNQPFSKFVINLRIHQACRLLAEEDMAVSDISWDCGFKTLSHFNKQFREVTQQTPSEYRKKYRELIKD